LIIDISLRVKINSIMDLSESEVVVYISKMKSVRLSKQ